jgi:hypothetical protein
MNVQIVKYSNVGSLLASFLHLTSIIEGFRERPAIQSKTLTAEL